MSNEVKQRKKGVTPSTREGKDAQRSGTASGERAQDEQPGTVVAESSEGGSRSLCADVRTLLSSLCLAMCGALIWGVMTHMICFTRLKMQIASSIHLYLFFAYRPPWVSWSVSRTVFQHSQNFAILEQKYQSLQSRSSALEELENKFGQVFGKLVSTDDILAEATASSSLVSNLQQQVSSLHNNIDRIQVNEQTLYKKMQNVNVKFQNITDSWKRSLDEINMETNSVKSETKSFHQQMTLKMNAADQTLKLISERLKEFQDSTPRNFRTVKIQEDNDLQRITDVLDWDDNAIKELEKEQNDLATMNEEVQQNLVKFQPKLAECIRNLPTIDNAVRTLLKFSKEMLDLDRKVNELTEQVFNTEDNLLKIITESLEIQHALEGMQYDNSILKMQNEISVLKEKVQMLSTINGNHLVEEKESDDG